MGIGEIINQTASEVYRSPSGVVSIANAHSTPPSGTVLNPEHNPAHNRTKLPPLGGGTPLPPLGGGTPLPPLGGGTPGGHPPPFQTSTQSNEVAAVGGRIPPFRKIFSDRNYTRYIYIGNTRYATREELERNHTEDARYINEQLANIITLPQTPPPPPSKSTEGQYLRRNNPDPHPDPHPPSWGGGTPGGTPLERLLFKGPKHVKRGSGITRVPPGVPPGVPPPSDGGTFCRKY